MKIVHIAISEKYVEGMSYQENLLSSAHKKLGYDVYIITQQSYINKNKEIVSRPIGSYVNDEGVNVTILPYARQNKFTKLFFPITKGLYEQLCEISPDIIFVHGVTAPDNREVVRYMVSNPNTVLYADNHNDYYNSPLKGLKGLIGKMAFRRNVSYLLPYVKCVWGTTPWRVEYLNEQYKVPLEKTGLLIMGADEQQIVGKNVDRIKQKVRSHYSIPSDAFLVVTGGTLDKRKKQDILMKAISKMHNENIWLLVFGSPTKEMEHVFASYKSVPNIVMTGWLPAEEGYDMFLASDLAFFPGTHSVLWEQAAACAIPVVVQHWEGMEHININGNALLLDTINEDVISKIISKLKFSTRWNQMKKNAVEVAAEFYLTEIAKRSIGI